jgi:hypothetical protein
MELLSLQLLTPSSGDCYVTVGLSAQPQIRSSIYRHFETRLQGPREFSSPSFGGEFHDTHLDICPGLFGNAVWVAGAS